MDDLISRQAAIDALDVLCQEHRYKIPGKVETYSQYNEAWQDALDRAEGAIGNLPSAQPEKRAEERTETHACDLVERQAAIDAAIKADMRNNDGILSEKRARVLDEYISRLPSVQPEHDYKKAFSVACELLIGANLFGVTEETMFREIMEKDGIVSSHSYEKYILDNLARLTGDE